MTPREQHKEYRSKPNFNSRYPPKFFDDFTEHEFNLLNRYGYWLKALDSGEIKPYTDAQMKFVRVCEAIREPELKIGDVWSILDEDSGMSREPKTEFEHLWILLYIRLNTNDTSNNLLEIPNVSGYCAIRDLATFFKITIKKVNSLLKIQNVYSKVVECSEVWTIAKSCKKAYCFTNRDGISTCERQYMDRLNGLLGAKPKYIEPRGFDYSTSPAENNYGSIASDDESHSDSMDEYRNEIDSSSEDYARSSDSGWYYAQSEGSFIDNIVDPRS